jgi:hypothetical protein
MTKTQQAFAVDAVAAGVSSWRIPMPVALLLAGYLVGVRLLGGMALSAMRFDQQRMALLAQLNDASTRVHARLMQMEKEATRGPSPDMAQRPADLRRAGP